MIAWITRTLGTAAWDDTVEMPGVRRIDVRDLVDKQGNGPKIVRDKIEQALSALAGGDRVVICCDYGMSRSNAIAVGVLARQMRISVPDATRQVLKVTGQTAIRIEMLSIVRQALGVSRSETEINSTRRRVLITGGSGFVGQALARELATRHHVVCPPRAQIDLAKGTIELDLLVKEQAIDTLVHLASPRVYTTNASLGDMLVMLKNVLDVCCENALRLVYPSSWEVFSGYRASELVADELLAPAPAGTYGNAKLLCENLIEQQRLRRGLNATVLRCVPTYGPQADRPKFIWNFLRKARANQEIAAHRYRNGHPRLDLMHVNDLGLLLSAVVERHVPGLFHVGTGQSWSTTQVADHLIARLHSKSTIRHHEIDAFAPNLVMDAARARTTWNWSPQISLMDGLDEIIRVPSPPSIIPRMHADSSLVNAHPAGIES